MTTERGSNKYGYALAFITGAVGGAVAAKRAPGMLAKVRAKMQEHCQQMMEAGCCAPSGKLAGACCPPVADEEATHPETRAA